jgi:hypothetical protein
MSASVDRLKGVSAPSAPLDGPDCLAPLFGQCCAPEGAMG